MPSTVKTGVDLLEKEWPRELKNTRAGLLIHPASVNSMLLPTATRCMQSSKFTVSSLFGPQHGLWGETQDNMIEWQGFRDNKTGIPVYSLYGKTRKPRPEMLKDIDLMIIDLQDVGARFYTFIWTMALVMEACQEMGKAVVVLDRPNPICGRQVEGPVLRPEYASFVGLHRLPVRHGMTIGEIGLYLKDVYYSDLMYFVIPMKRWKRDMWFDQTGLPWVLPSPNMPTQETAAVYPGMCLLEGTNLSEGRGTTRPFEIFGAPFIDPDAMVRILNSHMLRGAVFRPLHFLPTFQKHAGKLCGGAQIHVTDKRQFRPFKTAAAILKTIFELYPTKFGWKKPPYEYEKKLLPIDILAGTNRFREDIEQGRSLDTMETWWEKELTVFDEKIRRRYLIY
ncbi:MAG: DUF1343 domain-containing protein [Nitrospirae bacterium]|nr:DUF1343 domain-containing protein [Nitrospirota bacterium]